LETLELSESDAKSNPASEISFKREDKEVDPSSIIEIKTRSAGKSLIMSEVTPQLWISQTRHLVVAHHKNGIFDVVKVKDMRPTIRYFEESNRRVLVGLSLLLK
jgi:hypothetical protein